MAKYEVRVRYAFEGTYMVAAGNREEAKRMVEEDCGLVLGGNIHTTRDDDEVTEGSLTVIAEEKESGDEVECYGPFELGARNIDWLHEMYDAAWRQLEETKDVEPKTEEP